MDPPPSESRGCACSSEGGVLEELVPMEPWAGAGGEQPVTICVGTLAWPTVASPCHICGFAIGDCEP